MEKSIKVEWANPTGKPVREVDEMGAGWFGSPREGTRIHRGVDYTGYDGQEVVSPCNGVVRRLGWAYAASSLRLVVIDAEGGYTVRVLYVLPSVSKGQAILCGEPIGTLQSLQDRYPGITDHVHLDIKDSEDRWVDPESLVPPLDIA